MAHFIAIGFQTGAMKIQKNRQFFRGCYVQYLGSLNYRIGHYSTGMKKGIFMRFKKFSFCDNERDSMTAYNP